MSLEAWETEFYCVGLGTGQMTALSMSFQLWVWETEGKSPGLHSTHSRCSFKVCLLGSASIHLVDLLSSGLASST